MSDSKIKHVVADSGAFIRNAPLNAKIMGYTPKRKLLKEDALPTIFDDSKPKKIRESSSKRYEKKEKQESIGEKIYTVPKVVNEIKDKATLQRLQFLPYQLIPKTPSPECIRIVTDFSKKTGDYKSLSAVDIQVIALTFQLEKENVGTDHIKTVPDSKIKWTTSKAMLEKPTSIAGFYLAKGNTKRTTSECTVTSDLSDFQGKDGHSASKEDLTDQSITPQDNTCANQSMIDNINQSESNELEKDSYVDSTETNLTDREEREEDITVTAEMLEDADEDEGIEEDEEEEEDDDDGWITPSNITTLKQKMVSLDHEKVSVTVGCLTTDFAMQNVLIQMGLNVISVEGLLIRRAKSFVLRCFACMKITKDMIKEFCPYCGNNTLQKVSMTVEDDGSIRYFLSRRKPISTKGMKYQLPLPRGGKHSYNPVLVEDQPMPQQRAAKKKQHLDVFDPDFVVGQSPFALNDINSRSAQLGIRNNQFNKRCQNSNRHGRRK